MPRPYERPTNFPPRRWNAARAFASYLDHAPELYHDRFVLELGAGGGLPGLVAAKNGAKRVSLVDSISLQRSFDTGLAHRLSRRRPNHQS